MEEYDMKSTLKLVLTTLFCIALCLGLGASACAEGVAIDETNFPDEVFRSYVSTYCDQDEDGTLSESEIAARTEFYLYNRGIYSLNGIEFFTSLQDLDCERNNLTTLNLSSNTALTYLNCYGNYLTSLDVSGNTALILLNCRSNYLTSLDVSGNTALSSLYCGGNYLKSLDVSGNTALTSLSCNSNQLTSLDVSGNTALSSLNCGSNQLTSLDVSCNTALTSLNCDNNQLTSLDVSGNTALSSLNCYYNHLTSLNVSGNIALSSLDCGGNKLTSLDVSGNTALSSLSCWNNQLTSLDVSGNTALTSLYCGGNHITSLIVNNCEKLRHLECYSNLLTALDISNCPALVWLVENTQPFDGGSRYGGSNGGWSSDDTLLYYDNRTVTLITDPNNVVSVSFDKNAPDAESQMEPQPVNRDEEAVLKACTFTRAGYIFSSWNTESDGSGTSFIDGDSITISEDITLYAQWTEGYTIRFDKNADDATGTINPLLVPKGTIITLPNRSYYRNGYSFQGWNTAPDGTGTAYNDRASLTPTEDMTLFAQWKKIFRIMFYPNVSGSSTWSRTVTEGSSITIPSISDYGVTPPAGKEFDCWNTALDGSGIPYTPNTIIIPTTNMALYGQWKKATPPYEVVAINEQSFPDQNFRLYISNKLDTDGNASLSNREIAAVTSLSIYNQGINSLVGIEYFTSLQYLDCRRNKLTTLNLSSNTALTSLDCYNNQLTSLDVSGNTALSSLNCWSNQLTSLDVSGNTALTSLRCGGNFLTSLDVSGNAALTSLDCDNNQLTALDLSGCPSIFQLYCSGNQLASLNISHCPNLLALVENYTSYRINSGIIEFWDDDSAAYLRFDDSVIILTGTSARLLNIFNFPDPVFRAYVAENCDADKDGILSDEEIAAVTWIDCSGTEEERGAITSLKGVEFFSELTMLDCSCNRLSSLDLSRNARLEVLDCSNNLITRLNIGDNTALTTVWCYNNQLRELDLSGKNALTELWCNNNWLNTLELSGVPNLRVLWCHDNRLRALDPSSCPELVTLSCAINYLFELNVSMNSGLTTLWCSNNYISMLDLTGNAALRNLHCYANYISELNLLACPALMSLINNTDCTVNDGVVRYFDESSSDPVYLLYDMGVGLSIQAVNEDVFPDPAFLEYVASRLDTNRNGALNENEIDDVTSISVSNLGITSLKGIEIFTALKVLHCENNSLSELELNGFPALTTVYLNNNSLTRLELSGCPGLTTLYCADNSLTELDTSSYSSLNLLDCSSNLLADLNLSQNPQVQNLNCNDNQLRSLELGSNSELSSLYCQGNLLTELDLSGKTALTSLDCSRNLLSWLNVSGCGRLRTLNCDGNELAAIDLSGCEALSTLNCYGNRLSALDLSECASLRRLSCANNSLTALDLSGCNLLTTLTCQDNELTDLHVKNCPSLKTLTCQWNALTELDLSGCDALLTLMQNVDPVIMDGVVSYGVNNTGSAILSFDEGILLYANPTPDLTLPAALTAIGSEAFAGGSFTCVSIPAGVTSIADDAFGDRTSLTIIGVPGSTAEDFARAHGFEFVPAV